MTDVAPETVEALVRTASEAVHYAVGFDVAGWEPHMATWEVIAKADIALARLHSLLLRAEENADGSQLLRELAETALRRAEEALREQRDAGIALVLAWINRKYGTIPDDPPSLQELIQQAEEIEASIRFCPYCAHGYEWQESDPIEGPCPGCARAFRAEEEREMVAATMLQVADRLESGASGCKTWTKAEAARVLRRDAAILAALATPEETKEKL